MRSADPAFAAAFALPLLDPALPPPGNLGAGAPAKLARRYAVYRNNVTVGLIDALGELYPAVRRIVGGEFFSDMARLYLRARPPRSPLLFEYGRGLPDFIDAFEHTRPLPWLGDVARIERAWTIAYHAADRPPLTAAQLAAVDPARVAAARFDPHPAMQILRSAHPAVTIFAANRRDAAVGRIVERDPEDCLVTRPALEVFVRRLPPGTAMFFSALARGGTLGDAAGASLDAVAGFDIGAAISGMIEAGAFAAVRLSPSEHAGPSEGGATC